MSELETARLRLRRLSMDDADFILELLNDPSFIRFIGDKGVRTIEGARDYLVSGPLLSYAQLGFGLLLVELKDGRVPVGICGLIKRPTLADVDIGYAFLPRFRSLGYAVESAAAVIDHAKSALAIGRILAITDPANVGSIRVLEKIGLRFDRMVMLSEDDQALSLYTSDAKDG